MNRFQMACETLLARVEFSYYSAAAYLASHRGDAEETAANESLASQAEGRLDQLSIERRFS